MDGNAITRVEIVYNNGTMATYEKKDFDGVGFHEGCFVVQTKDGVHRFTPLVSIKDLFLVIPTDTSD